MMEFKINSSIELDEEWANKVEKEIKGRINSDMVKNKLDVIEELLEVIDESLAGEVEPEMRTMLDWRLSVIEDELLGMSSTSKRYKKDLIYLGNLKGMIEYGN